MCPKETGFVLETPRFVQKARKSGCFPEKNLFYSWTFQFFAPSYKNHCTTIKNVSAYNIALL
jgi:hypothetical protein